MIRGSSSSLDLASASPARRGLARAPHVGTGRSLATWWALVALVAIGCGSGASAVTAGGEHETQTLAEGDVADRVLLTGTMAAGVAVTLDVPRTEAWQLTVRWLAEDGVQVKAGDRVVEFDNSAFTTGLVEKKLAVVDAKTALDTSRQVAAVSAEVKKHEVQQAKIALDKATLLASVPADLVSVRTVQERRLELTRAQLAYKKAQQDLETERKANALEAKVKQIALDKAKRTVEAAERAIDELVLRAPRDGVVSIGDHPWEGRRFQVGDTVQPGFAMATLPDFSKPMEVHAELSDVDDGRIAVGAKGTCTLDAYAREPLSCTVTQLAPVAIANKRTSLRRMFSVTLSIAKSDPKRMRPGMSVKVELRGTPHHGLVASRGAILEDPETHKAVLRMAGGELREVELGACDAQRCVIAHGATSGETVAMGGS